MPMKLTCSGADGSGKRREPIPSMDAGMTGDTQKER